VFRALKSSVLSEAAAICVIRRPQFLVAVEWRWVIRGPGKGEKNEEKVLTTRECGG